MKRPDLTFTWRSIEFEWSVPANAYIADTGHGRWMVQRHANDENQYFARFGPYAGGWSVTPGEALDNVRHVAVEAHAKQVQYLKDLRP